MYALAGDRAQREVMRSLTIQAAESAEKVPALLKRKRTHVKHAIEQLLAADMICPIHIEPFTVTWTGSQLSATKIPVPTDLRSTVEQLRAVHQELQDMEDDFTATVHPNLRAVGLNSTAGDYRFIAALATLLSSVGCTEVNKVISEMFKAAFGESYDLERITTVRKRLARRAKSGRGQGQNR
jgi:hypothetical protein